MKALTEKPVQTRLTTWGCGLVCGMGLLTSNAAKATASTINILYSFTGRNDSGKPEARLIADKEGNLFSTTAGAFGGESRSGTVFELTPNGTLNTLYRFTGHKDGAVYPRAGLIADKEGNLFGTTTGGGTSGHGTVFELTDTPFQTGAPSQSVP